MYVDNIRIQEADVVEAFLPAFHDLHPSRYKQERGRIRTRLLDENQTQTTKSKRDHLHAPATDEALVKGVLME